MPVANPRAYNELYLTLDQACIANITLRQLTLQKQCTGTITNVSKYIGPIDDVLSVMKEQQRQLAEYKERFGDLE